ncbi:MAG: 30S ribosome-binding factor RbfA, partial [Clostridiales bacterium]
GRMAGEIQKEIADILSYEIKDPRLGFVSVLSVEVSGDFSWAKIHISSMDDDTEGSLAALESAKGFIRRELGKRLKVRIVPDLTFHLDNSIAYGIRMTELINKQIKRDEETANRPKEDYQLEIPPGHHFKR